MRPHDLGFRLVKNGILELDELDLASLPAVENIGGMCDGNCKTLLKNKKLTLGLVNIAHVAISIHIKYHKKKKKLSSKVQLGNEVYYDESAKLAMFRKIHALSLYYYCNSMSIQGHHALCFNVTIHSMYV